jgi:hypothetical protein
VEQPAGEDQAPVATVTEGADEPVDEGALGFGGEADDAHDDDGAADAPAAATPDAADPLNQSTDIYASAPAYIPVSSRALSHKARALGTPQTLFLSHIIGHSRPLAPLGLTRNTALPIGAG